jgi:phosphoribosylglycinamide formyltransferase-1
MSGTTPTLPVAVLASGTGSNLRAILRAADSDPDFGAEVVLVLSDRPDAGALDIARSAGVATALVPREPGMDRDAHTAAICDEAERHGARALVLAGFMWILGPEAMARFPNAVLNTHPALLPAFPGDHAVRDALAWGAKVTGCTVHFVDELVDHGPIIAQEAVPILPADTEETLHGRIKEVEHQLFPRAIKALAHRDLAVEGRIVKWGSAEREPGR